jgi:hypothetical protein
MTSIFNLMKDSPSSFYTRGGRELWDAIKIDIGNQPIPSNSRKLKSIFSESFKNITGHDIESRGVFYLESLNSGGMSGGQISPEFFNEVILFWLETKLKGQKMDSTHPLFMKWSS